jgi:hypothetical protein
MSFDFELTTRQKTERFITTALRTSDCTHRNFLLLFYLREVAAETKLIYTLIKGSFAYIFYIVRYENWCLLC